MISKVLANPKVKVSVIMPAYEVEDEIVDVVYSTMEALAKVVNDYELIIVDDGSRDGTFEKLKMLAKDNHVKIIRYPVNLGKGAAVKTGVRYATGEYAILLDADRDIDPGNIRFYIEALKEYDVVVGSKRHPSTIYEAPFIRKFLSLGFNAIVKLLTGIRVGDTQTGFKAFKTRHLKTIMDIIVVKRYAYDVEVLAVAHMLGLKILEAPVRIRQKSLFKLREALRMLLDILGITYRLRVVRWYQRNISKVKLKPLSRI